MAEFTFCRGTSIRDNHPRVCRVPDFDAFVSAIDQARAPEKDGAGYFCGPLNGDGLRVAQGALERNWLALDLDRIEPDGYPDVCMWFARFSGFGWPTHSSTPEAPRLRVVLQLDRNASRGECMEVGRVLIADMAAEFGAAVMVDPSTLRGEQPLFNPPQGVTLARYDGEALAVDRYLAAAPKVPVLTVVPPTGPGAKVQANRNEYLSRRAYRLARDGLAGEPLAAALLALNREICDPPLGDEEVRGIAARKKIVPPAPEEPAAQPDQHLLLSLAQLEAACENTSWAVKHVLPSNAVGMMFGAPGTFKSFVALDMALHIAHGMPWMGRKTTKGAVIYIAAEGGTGLWRRIKAWHQARHLKWESVEFFVVPIALELQDNAEALVQAASMVGVVPLLVVVDTLSQTFQGEENSASDMAAYLRALGVSFRVPWACSVVVIHHSGHSATERPRGSSAIQGNTDFLFGVFRDEDQLIATLTCQRQKDGDLFKDAQFELTPQQLGKDKDGDAVTSLVARHISGVEELAQVHQREAGAGRGGRNMRLVELAHNGITERELRKAFYDEMPGADPEARKKAYQRAKGWARAVRLLDFANDGNEYRVIVLNKEAP